MPDEARSKVLLRFPNPCPDPGVEVVPGVQTLAYGVFLSLCGLLLLGAGEPPPGPQPVPPGSATPVLVLLQETGEERDGLPVLKVATGAEEVADRLGRGLSGALLRVYGWV